MPYKFILCPHLPCKPQFVNALFVNSCMENLRKHLMNWLPISKFGVREEIKFLYSYGEKGPGSVTVTIPFLQFSADSVKEDTATNAIKSILKNAELDSFYYIGASAYIPSETRQIINSNQSVQTHGFEYNPLFLKRTAPSIFIVPKEPNNVAIKKF